VNQSLPHSGKKPYSTPAIRIYGDIRVVTQAATTMHVTGDGGMTGVNKT